VAAWPRTAAAARTAAMQHAARRSIRDRDQ